MDYLARFGIFDKCSRGDGYYNVLSAFSVHFRALAVFAVLGCKFALIAECKKGVCTLVNSDDNITAPAAVAAIRTACGYIFLAAEGNGTVTAVACLYVNFNFIYKHIISFRDGFTP